MKACEHILNREGSRNLEVRPIRIENRGTSRCSWEGCDCVTPKRENAIRDALAQQVYTVIQASVKEDPSLQSAIDSELDTLEVLAKRVQAAIRAGQKDEEKSLWKKTRNLLKNLGKQFYKSGAPEEQKKKAWKDIQDATINLMKYGKGRNRYCREHSRMYVDTILLGNAVPFKKTVTESDIISRREQMAFSKLWRYIEARVLPLAPEGIDRIVVERTAIDLLAGKQKVIRKATDRFIEELYQEGPMYGFRTVREMLREEFGGLCAYCGKPSGNLVECDHILPRAEFFFDGYLNILPACPDCNANVKRAGRMSDTCGNIHEDAYKAYCNYLARKYGSKPMHSLHAQKKGVLNLMRDPGRAWEAERYLVLIANEYAVAVQANRGWRLFAKYLCMKLERAQGSSPAMQAKSGRHTAIFRHIAYPDFDKYNEKKRESEEKERVNHAVDAIILASDLPFPYPLEGRTINWGTVQRWMINVRKSAPPANADGIPLVPRYDFSVPGFESEHDGYLFAYMAQMNWNWKDRATHKQDPYGVIAGGKKAVKRERADGFYTELIKEKSDDKIRKKIANVCHPGLRQLMTAALTSADPGKASAEAMKGWLRKSVNNSLASSTFSNNPGDVARREILERFSNGEDMPIPSVIGVRCVSETPRGSIDLERIDPRTKDVGHVYQTDPTNKGVILAYPKKKGSGEPDYAKPCLAYIRQNNRLEVSGKVFLPLPPELANGRRLGEHRSNTANQDALIEDYLRSCGFVCYVVVKQGCVLCYRDGSTRYLRNFAEDYGFKVALLKNVSGIRRTPFSGKQHLLIVL